MLRIIQKGTRPLNDLGQLESAPIERPLESHDESLSKFIQRRDSVLNEKKELEKSGTNNDKVKAMEMHGSYGWMDVSNKPKTLAEYFKELHTPTQDTLDICEHLDILFELALGCEVIVEMGFRTGTSFCAFLMGQPKRLETYDLYIPKNFREILQGFADDNKINCAFHEENTLTADIIECDMLFIDTLHTYGQLRHELQRHAIKARKYLVFHDTETYGRKSENGESLGLMDAIEDFLEKHKEWEMLKHYPFNNGLSILKRTADQTLDPVSPDVNGN